MPLLMCPNCKEGMRELTREGVQLDMCPSCHGVWLDRGELQKLLETAKAEAAPAYAPEPQRMPPRPAPVEHYSHHHGHGKYRKKSKLESIFDIFD